MPSQQNTPTTPSSPSLPQGQDHSQHQGTAASLRTTNNQGSLRSTLNEVFGFDDFRPYQEAVCTDVIKGEDVLLVMPTGAGKSICYQLPGLIRTGTTLVVSPLIALIDDQVTKLQAWGLRAEAIHSGRDRSQAQQTCRSYLQGTLDFLFIAPERLGVPGFLELLAKRKPSLIAVDEAHCISCWGHDFRPDYRLLAERLPKLRPCPIIGLTATATPLVQQDIEDQLAMNTPKRHTHGFRRKNIAVEVTEMPAPQRIDAVVSLLKDPANRPAIIYAPSRAKTEEAAAALADLGAHGYHAGMPPSERFRIQESFLSGKSDIIVATIAFGMGIDKPNVRTIIHLALPSSVEGYYQEIGRAGRDGLPSQAILLHSYLDFRQHEFFLKRNYPELSYLSELRNQVGSDGIHKDALLAGHDRDLGESALEKLWVHGGLQITPDEMVYLGGDDWARRYKAQRDHREDQTQQMGRYAQNQNVCRMIFMIKHFGDNQDSGEDCGLCDICNPQVSQFRKVREPSSQEKIFLDHIIAFLYERLEPISKGKLYSLALETKGVSRSQYELWLAALSQAGLIKLESSQFRKDGRNISYYTVALTETCNPRKIDWQRVQIPDYHQRAGATGKAPSRNDARKTKRPAKDQAARAAPLLPTDVDEGLLAHLKSWRLQEAHKRKVPAFCILPDRTLMTIAAERPHSESDLANMPGIGPARLKKYARQLLTLLKANA